MTTPKVREQKKEQTISPEEQAFIDEQTTLAEQLRLKQEADEKNLREFAQILKEIDPQFAPSLDQLRHWKSQFGNIYMSSVTDDSEVFIWRVVLRLEWKELLSSMDMKNDLLRQETIIKKFLLYPHPDKVLYQMGAGYMASIESAIMYQSGFVNEGTILSSIKIIE